MNQWRSKDDLEQQIADLKKELASYKDSCGQLQQQLQTLKLQNERLLKMEAEHQTAKTSLMRKRIILSRAVILIPENMVIGDRMENSILKIYRGITLIISDAAQLINCRIIGMEHYGDLRQTKGGRVPVGTIEIKGMFYNTDHRHFSISTHERVVISKGVRFRGNVRAGSIVISDLTKVRGRFATRDLWEERRRRVESLRIASNILESGVREITMEDAANVPKHGAARFRNINQ